MTFAVLILVAVMCALAVLIAAIVKLFKTDDYLDDDVIATYPSDQGMAPSRMVRAGDTFFMVYEDSSADRFGIGMGTRLDDLQLIYSTESGRVLDIIGKDNYVVWSQLDSDGISVRTYYVNTGELEKICEKQDAGRVSGSVGVCDYCAYFEEADEDGTKVNIVEYNLETGDEKVIESVHVVDGVSRPIEGFKVYHNIMTVIEQDLTSEIRLAAVDLNTLVKSDIRMGVTGISDGRYELTVDKVIDIAPNLHRMTYMIHAIEKGKGVVYEVGDKKTLKCAMVDGREVRGSLGSEFGIVYWIEEVVKGGAVTRELHGYNSTARQHIIKINGVSSYVMDEDDMYYFHEHPETGQLALCRRGVAGNIKTLDMAAAKAEHKERKKQKKLKGKE
ncbi:MAG: hypothetical protein MR492_02520 [Clostridiales bacterium]|nr:hypothetical protein [Clostridiales bacterium]MDD7016517.1 hypothetical protein [Bacillota bacterium]MDY4960070.1 hypothetical protein [Lentihominibacter sp.]